MPQKKADAAPPPVMTWSKAAPILVAAALFDALRFMFEWFIFFGPALAAAYCTTTTSNTLSAWTLGILGGKTAAIVCSAGAVAAGIAASEIIGAFGLIMAMVTAFAGWLLVLLLLLFFNRRIFIENSLWFGASLLVSAVPFVGSIPAITIAVWRMYSHQIKIEREAFKAYRALKEADALVEQRRQSAQLLQIQEEARQQEEAVAAEEDEQEEGIIAEKARQQEEEGGAVAEEAEMAAVGESLPARSSGLGPYLRSPAVSPQQRRAVSSLPVSIPTSASLAEAHRPREVVVPAGQGGRLAANDSGSIDVKTVARERNAVVVREIPVDGWPIVTPPPVGDAAPRSGSVAVSGAPSRDSVAAIVSAEAGEVTEQMQYPLALVVDGAVISAAASASTVPREAPRESADTRERHTLARSRRERLRPGMQTASPAYDNVVVRDPKLRAVLVDEEKLINDLARGDVVTETFLPNQRFEALRKYGSSILSTMPGMDAGKPVLRVSRRRTGLQKALDVAAIKYPYLPVYIKRQDGIYSTRGTKVSAGDIYAQEDGGEIPDGEKRPLLQRERLY